MHQEVRMAELARTIDNFLADTLPAEVLATQTEPRHKLTTLADQFNQQGLKQHHEQAPADREM